MGESDPGQQIISNLGRKDEEIDLEGYQFHLGKTIGVAVVFILALVSLLVLSILFLNANVYIIVAVFLFELLILCLTLRSKRLKMTIMYYVKCSLELATKLLIKDSSNCFREVGVVEEKSSQGPKQRYFSYKNFRYVWNANQTTFDKLKAHDEGKTFESFHDNQEGLATSTAKERGLLYGSNSIKTVIPPSTCKLILNEVFKPINLLKFVCILILMAIGYFWFSGAAVIFIFMDIKETKKQMSLTFENTTKWVMLQGYMTRKYGIIRAQQNTKSKIFRFNKDLLWKWTSISFSIVLTAIGTPLLAYFGSNNKVPKEEIIFQCLFMATMMTYPIGPFRYLNALRRLNLKNFKCIFPKHIILWGCVNFVCFEMNGILMEINTQLKENVSETIDALHNRRIATIILTENDLQTAVTVAEKCGMIGNRIIPVKASWNSSTNKLSVDYENRIDDENDSFAMDGQSFEVLRRHDPNLLKELIKRVRVYGEMTPDQKKDLLKALETNGNFVAMVADGHKDFEALGTASVGISLSMIDTLIAVPFSSKAGISSVLRLIIEGRATLEATCRIFQYSTGIRIIVCILLVFLSVISAKLSDVQLVALIFGICLPLLNLMVKPSPSEYLNPRRPFRPAILLTTTIISSVLWSTFQVVFFFMRWNNCHQQQWFEPFDYNATTDFPAVPIPSYEATNLFFLSCIGSILAFFVSAQEEFFSRRILKTKVFLWLVIPVALTLCLMFTTNQGIVNFMNFKKPEDDTKATEYELDLLIIGFIAGVMVWLFEKWILGPLYKMIWPFCYQLLPAIRLRVSSFSVFKMGRPKSPYSPCRPSPQAGDIELVEVHCYQESTTNGTCS